jgi:hypothetical protein
MVAQSVKIVVLVGMAMVASSAKLVSIERLLLKIQQHVLTVVQGNINA